MTKHSRCEERGRSARFLRKKVPSGLDDPRRHLCLGRIYRATESRVDLRVSELIASDGPLAVTEPVMLEVLAGARTEEQEQDLRRLLLRFELLRFDSSADFDGGVRIYRRCRKVGVTPRGLIDCTIASVAQRLGATLLAHDAELTRVAKVIGIEMDTASLSL